MSRGVQRCRTCNTILSREQKKFCSRQCLGRSRIDHLRRISATGGRAPKPRAPFTRIYGLCSWCHARQITTRRSRTCCLACGYELRKSRTKPLPPNRVCEFCGADYHSYQKGRRYCSYACAINGGSSLRAGLASSKTRAIYGAKKDRNHQDITNAIRASGAPMFDLSNLGGGVPDGIAWVSGRWLLFEVKNPDTAYGRRGLNAIQRKWLSQWPGGAVYIVRTVNEASRFAGGDLEGIDAITQQCARGVSI